MFQELSQIKALHAALLQRFAESRVRLLVLVDLQDSEQDLVTQELGQASCNDDGRDGKERVVVTWIRWYTQPGKVLQNYMENYEIVDFFRLKMVIFHSYVNIYQRV